jgi:hypothetical protein
MDGALSAALINGVSLSTISVVPKHLMVTGANLISVKLTDSRSWVLGEGKGFGTSTGFHTSACYKMISSSHNDIHLDYSLSRYLTSIIIAAKRTENGCNRSARG